MRLIDADKLVTELMDSDLDHLQRDDWKEVIQIVQDAPTIQPERKKGRWNFEEYPDGYYHSECDQCGRWFGEEAYMDHWNFCPNCGADMRAEHTRTSS